LLERGVGMSGVAANPLGAAGADKGFCAGQFGSNRGSRDAISIGEVLLKLARLRFAYRSGRVTAARFRREIGAVEMSAEDACTGRLTLRRSRTRLQPATDFEEGKMLFVSRDRGRRQ